MLFTHCLLTDSSVTILSTQGSCCQKSWFDQKHLVLLSVGLNLGFIPTVDFVMWSLMLAIGSVAVILNCFLDYAEQHHTCM